MKLKILRSPTLEGLEKLFNEFATALGESIRGTPQINNDGVNYYVGVFYILS